MSVRSSGPIGLQLRPASLKTAISFSSLFRARFHYVLAKPCRLIAVYLLLITYILTVPYMLSLVNYYYIRFTLPPPKAY